MDIYHQLCHDLVVMWLIKRRGFWIGHWIYSTLTILRYTSQWCSHQFSVTFYNSLQALTESSRYVVPHQSPGTGFQRWTFPFLGSLTIPAPQPQWLLTQSPLINSILLAPLHTLSLHSTDAVQLPTSYFSITWCFPFGPSQNYIEKWGLEAIVQ
jgi:hypothetical protein